MHSCSNLVLSPVLAEGKSYLHFEFTSFTRQPLVIRHEHEVNFGGEVYIKQNYSVQMKPAEELVNIVD